MANPLRGSRTETIQVRDSDMGADMRAGLHRMSPPLVAVRVFQGIILRPHVDARVKATHFKRSCSSANGCRPSVKPMVR